MLINIKRELISRNEERKKKYKIPKYVSKLLDNITRNETTKNYKGFQVEGKDTKCVYLLKISCHLRVQGVKGVARQLVKGIIPAFLARGHDNALRE